MSEVIKVSPPKPVEEIPAAQAYDFTEFLTPGIDRSKEPGYEPGRAQGTGLCDGVIYLLGRKDHTGVPLLPDMFHVAMQYLKPQSPVWLAQNTDLVGRSKPDIGPILQNFPKVAEEIQNICEETRQGASWMFLSCKRSIEASRPENVRHWHLVKAQEGIWCVIWH